MLGQRSAALTSDEQSALDAYRGRNYIDINGMLWRPDWKPSSIVSREAVEKQLSNMESAMAKSATQRNQTLWRGMDGELLGDLQVGQVVEDKGFMSTSPKRDVAVHFATNESGTTKPIVAKLSVPAGTHAISMTDGPPETVLDHGQSWQVTKVTQRGGVTYVEGEILPKGTTPPADIVEPPPNPTPAIAPTLTDNQTAALRYLAEHGEPEHSMNRLGRALDVRHTNGHLKGQPKGPYGRGGAAHGVVRSLESQGLVQSKLVDGPDGKPTTGYELTDAGRSALGTPDLTPSQTPVSNSPMTEPAPAADDSIEANTVRPGDYVTLEERVNRNGKISYRNVYGIAKTDSEGTVRVNGVNVSKDAKGYYPFWVTIDKIRKPGQFERVAHLTPMAADTDQEGSHALFAHPDINGSNGVDVHSYDEFKHVIKGKTGHRWNYDEGRFEEAPIDHWLHADKHGITRSKFPAGGDLKDEIPIDRRRH